MSFVNSFSGILVIHVQQCYTNHFLIKFKVKCELESRLIALVALY